MFKDTFKEIGENEIIALLSKNTVEAKKIFKNEERMKKFIEYLEPIIDEFEKSKYSSMNKISILFLLVKDYTSKLYSEIDEDSIILIIAALIEFLNASNCLAAAIHVHHQMTINARTVLVYVSELLKSEVKEYKKWKIVNYER